MRSILFSSLVALFAVLVVANGSRADDSPFGDSPVDERLIELERRLSALEGPPAIAPMTDDDEPVGGETPGDPSSEEDEESPTDALIERLDKLEGKVFAPVTEPTFEIGGRIHLDYWGFPSDSPGIGFFENPGTGADPEDRVTFRRMRFEAKGDIFETMFWRLQAEFADPNNTEFRDVFIGFGELPANQVLLVGNHKRPLGFDHLNSSRYNVFLERPLGIEAFNEDARRLGIAAWGHSDDESVGWAYGVFNLERVQDDGTYIGDAKQLSLNGRLWGSPWYDECSGGRGFLHLAVAGMVANPDGSRSAIDTNENEGRFRTRPSARSNRRWIDTGRIAGARYYEVLAAEAMLNIGALEITGEFQTSWMQRDDFSPGTGDDLFFHGGYVHVGYFLTGESMMYDRTSGTLDRVEPFENFFLVDRCCGGTGGGWGAWQIAARLDYLDLSSQDIRGGRQYDATLALNWHWTSHSKLQFNVVYGDIDEHAPVGGFTDGHFLLVGTRFAAEF